MYSVTFAFSDSMTGGSADFNTHAEAIAAAAEYADDVRNGRCYIDVYLPDSSSYTYSPD